MNPLIRFSLLVLLGTSSLTKATELEPFKVIYDQVIQTNAAGAVSYCISLQQTLNSESAEQRHSAFVQLVEGWASVQASYVLGGYDMDAMDYPLMVDNFHMGKEDIHESLARLIKSDTAATKALYKTSYKTLGALDDVMFSGPWSARRKELADVMAVNVCKKLALIRDGYREHRAEFLEDPDKALSLLINAQIEDIYKTRDWRIAQISGLTKKTFGQPMPQKQQYPYSQASWAAIGAQMKTHHRLLAEDLQPNMATIAHQKKAEEGMAAVQADLQAALLAYRETPAGHHYDTNDMIPFYQGLKDLQTTFYDQLVSRMGVTAKLIDADGD